MSERSTPSPARRGASRPVLSPGLTTFLVVDVILVLTFLVLLAMSLANGPTDRDAAATPPADPTASDTSSGEPEPETSPDQSAPPEPEQNEALTDFVLPSGNIYCSMTETTATCTILSFSYEPPPLPEGCTGTVGAVLEITADGAPTFPCVTEPPTGPAPGTPELAYGEGSTIGQTTCLSSRNGVFCRDNPSGRGFSVARAGHQFF